MTMRSVLAGMTACGISMAITGCSDPVPPPAQGAVQLKVSSLPTAEIAEGEKNCNFPGIDFALGTVNVTSRTSVTDGTNGTAVHCRVAPRGAGFDVSASIDKGDDSFSVSGFVQSGQDTEGDVTLSLQQTSTLLGSKIKCTVSVARTDAAPSLAVGPGRVWAKVECTKLSVNGFSPPQYCRAAGVFVFESCEE